MTAAVSTGSGVQGMPSQAEPPFEVGTRLRLKPRLLRPRTTFTHAVVVAIRYYPSWGWNVRLRSERTGGRKVLYLRNGSALDELDWEPVPDADLSLDAVAAALAKAVLAGDNAAALALADRVFELLRG